MKRSTLIAGIAVMTLAAGAGVATAHGKKAGMDGMRGGPVLNFEEIDANGDGKLTQDEMKAHAKARFKAADTDGNGKLSADEMKAAAQKREEERRAQRAERMASRMIERMDKDGDKELSFDEMPGQMTQADRMFARVDADGDGAISKDEMEKARERFGERQGMRDGHRGPFGEGGHHGKRWND